MLLNNNLIFSGTPESQGISSQLIIDFMDYVNELKMEMHSFQIIRNNCLVASAVAKPMALDRQHRIYSSAKAIMAIGVLLAIQEGLVTLDEKIIDIFSNYLPDTLDEKMKKVTVYNLLTMNSGHSDDVCMPMFESNNYIKTFLSIAPDFEPGTHFTYNNGIPHLLAAIIKEKTGQDINTYMKPRFLDPLGIEMYCRDNKQGEYEPSNVSITQEALTKIGFFFLNKGNWNGKQLLRQDLCEDVGRYHVPTAASAPDEARRFGYGYQIWRTSFGGYFLAGGRNNHSLVLPEVNMVFSCMANNMDQSKDIVKAFGDKVYPFLYKYPISENPKKFEELTKRIKNWNLAPKGSDRSTTLNQISGKTYQFEKNPFGNETISFIFDDKKNALDLKVVRNGIQNTISCGFGGEWPETKEYILIDVDKTHGNFIHKEDDTITMASGAWADKNTFVFYARGKARMCTDKFVFKFIDETLSIEVKTSTISLPGYPNKLGKGEFLFKGLLKK
jgi:CubicO group peptidase (beta-lactamase class C family)